VPPLVFSKIYVTINKKFMGKGPKKSRDKNGDHRYTKPNNQKILASKRKKVEGKKWKNFNPKSIRGDGLESDENFYGSSSRMK
jgi:hypothetical protein